MLISKSCMQSVQFNEAGQKVIAKLWTEWFQELQKAKNPLSSYLQQWKIQIDYLQN